MNKTINFLITEKNISERLDLYLSRKMEFYSRSLVKKLINDKHVKVNGEIVKFPAFKVKSYNKVSIKLIFKNEKKLTPKNIHLDIIYEDNDILIINKPKGLVVHPGAGNYENTLANGLAYKYKNKLSNISGNLRPGIIHRIDKDTSGLLVVAKNNIAHAIIGKQFSNHSIDRKYECLIWGTIRPLSGKIETLITRNKRNRQLMTVSEINGKRAITNYKTIKVFTVKGVPKISLVECRLETGRTHQIRVHIKYKGSSLLGDNQYGKRNIKFKKSNKDFLQHLNNIKGQALHAKTLSLIHPTKKILVNFKSKLPEDFKKMLDFLYKFSS